MNTEERIRYALLELMSEKRLEEITIIAIADKSRINRTTVYRYYVDKYAILQTIEDNIIQELNDIDQDTASSTQGNTILRILRAINEKRSIISVLLGENGDQRFHERFITLLTTKGMNSIERSPRFNGLDSRQKELLAQYISSALLGLIKYWLRHPEMSVEELDAFFENLFRNVLNSFIKP